MDLSALKTQIKLGNIAPFYIFVGPEVKVMDIYLAQMAKAKNGTVKYMQNLEELAKKAHLRTAISSTSVYVLRDCKEFISDYDLALKLTQKNAFGDNPIVFVYATIDKRSKAYKNFQDNIVEFNPLSDDVLVKYVQREIPLSQSTCVKLIHVCENDYSRILLEIDKIKAYAAAKETTDYDRVFGILLGAGVIYQPPYDAVFDFVDAVLRNEECLAFSRLAQSYACGEATMVLLTNLYNGAKQLLQVQGFDGNGKITEVTGLTPFQVKLASGRKGRNSNSRLVHLMNLTREAEKGIKIGEIDESLAIEFILTNFWRG